MQSHRKPRVVPAKAGTPSVSAIALIAAPRLGLGRGGGRLSQ
jgi:hypothetical protein